MGAWSLMDNFEWGAGYSERFGIHFVNRTTGEFKREVKESCHIVKNIVENNGFPEIGPTEVPTNGPTDEPTDGPTDAPTDEPTDRPTDGPTEGPTDHQLMKRLQYLKRLCMM